MGIGGVIGKDVELLGLAEIRKSFHPCDLKIALFFFHPHYGIVVVCGRVYQAGLFCTCTSRVPFALFSFLKKKSGSFRRRAYVYCGDQRTHLRVQNVDRLLVLALF